MNSYVIPLICEQTQETAIQVVNLDRALDMQFRYELPCIIIITPFSYE